MSLDPSDLVFFFGAGASAPFGIPTMKQFVLDFEKLLDKTGTKGERELYHDIKDTLTKQLEREIDLEDVFTVIDGCINLNQERLGLLSLYLLPKAVSKFTDHSVELELGKRRIHNCKRLKDKFQKFVRNKCRIPPESFAKISQVYKDFFNRLITEATSLSSPPVTQRRGHRYCRTWAMFTTNYDICLEYYWRETVRVPLNTGFSFDQARNTMVLNPHGLYREGEEMRLLKLHGSISWLVEHDGSVIEEQTLGSSLVGRKVIGEMMIYPVEQKELYVDPYISMFVQLNRELANRSVWIVIGYSFNDPIIREIFVRNSDENKRIILVHPNVQEVFEQRLKNIKYKQMFPLNQKFGEDNFTVVNHLIIKQLKTNPSVSPTKRL